MKLFVMASGKSDRDGAEILQAQPEFRKATGNMLMAASAIKKVLNPEIENHMLSLVVGSSYGELETTNSFFAALSQTGVARPFLFQSSLHNATSGFVTLHYGIRGPSITVSNRFFTGESALEAAALLLETGQAKLTLVVTVDCYVLDFAEPFASVYQKSLNLYDSSTAMLLANADGLKLLHKKPLATLENVELFTSAKEKFSSSEYNDSNALELLTNDINSMAPKNKLKLTKPDGTYSVISWSKQNL